MSRWIDPDALIAFIKNQYFQCDMPEEWGNGVMWATSQINHYCNKAPSIDIVRCGECKYCDTGIDEDGNKFWKCLGIHYGGVNPDDFCSYGERSEP